MDDIDKTFEKLKRKPLIELIREWSRDGRISVVVNPNTFELEMFVRKELLDGTGWNASDFDDVLTGIVGAKIVVK